MIEGWTELPGNIRVTQEHRYWYRNKGGPAFEGPFNMHGDWIRAGMTVKDVLDKYHMYDFKIFSKGPKQYTPKVKPLPLP